jgi:hypothetical protein
MATTTGVLLPSIIYGVGDIHALVYCHANVIRAVVYVVAMVSNATYV